MTEWAISWHAFSRFSCDSSGLDSFHLINRNWFGYDKVNHNKCKMFGRQNRLHENLMLNQKTNRPLQRFDKRTRSVLWVYLFAISDANFADTAILNVQQIERQTDYLSIVCWLRSIRGRAITLHNTFRWAQNWRLYLAFLYVVITVVCF